MRITNSLQDLLRSRVHTEAKFTPGPGRHTGVYCNPYTGAVRGRGHGQPDLEDGASGHVYHLRQDRDNTAAGEVTESHLRQPPSQGEAQSPARPCTKPARTGPAVSPSRGSRPHSGFQRIGNRFPQAPAPICACAERGLAKRSQESKLRARPVRQNCRVPGTQGTLQRPSLPDQRTLRSSPVARRLARRARAYMAPLHSAGCNADRQLTGRI